MIAQPSISAAAARSLEVVGGDPVVPGLVSVIVPSYNTARFIGETLDSICAQTYRDYEIIVINDGSPDSAALEQVLAPYGERIIYLKQENRGLAGARNTGLRIARGEYVAFLDSDDAWEPTYLEAQLALLDRDPTIAVLYCDGHIFGTVPEAGRRLMELAPSAGPVTFESIVSRRCNVQVMVTARRAAIIAAGGFDESLRSSEDFDLWLRMAKRGHRIAYQTIPLTKYRRREDSLSADVAWMCQHVIRVLDKAERELGLTESERTACEQRRRYQLAAASLEEGKAAFLRGEPVVARRKVREANQYFASPRLALVRAILAVCPGLLLQYHRWRESRRFNPR